MFRRDVVDRDSLALFGGGEARSRQFVEAAWAGYRAQSWATLLSSVASGALVAIGLIAPLITLWWSAQLVALGQMSLGTSLALSLLTMTVVISMVVVGALMPGVTTMVDAWRRLQEPLHLGRVEGSLDGAEDSIC